MEMETDEEEEDDYTRSEEENTSRARIHGRSSEDHEQPVTKDDLLRGQITRNMLAKYCMAPWFEEFVRGPSFLCVPQLFVMHV